MKNDIISVNEYLECITLSDIQSTAKLYGKNDSSELVNLSYNTGRFHNRPSVSYKLYPTKTQVIL